MKKITLLITAILMAVTHAVGQNVDLSQLATESPTGLTVSAEGGTIDNVANLLNSGNNTVVYLCAENSTEIKSVIVDLQQTYAIAKTTLTWEGACPSDYKIYVSNDNSTWAECVSITGKPTGNGKMAPVDHELNIKGRYIKLTPLKAGNSAWGIKLYEIGVTVYQTSTENTSKLFIQATPTETGINQPVTYSYFGVDNNNKVVLDPTGSVITVKEDKDGAEIIKNDLYGKNSYTFTSVGSYIFTYQAEGGRSAQTKVSVIKPFTNIPLSADMVWVDQDTSDEGISNAFDDNYNSTWDLQSTTADTEEAKTYERGFILDLRGTYDLQQAAVTFETAAPADFTISVSADGKTFSPVAEKTGVSGDNPQFDFDIERNSASTGVRYVKFLSTKAATLWGIKIRTFTLTGYQVSDATNDNQGPTFTPQVTPGSSKATVKLDATDASGEYVYYKFEQTTPTDGATTTRRLTDMHSGNYTHVLTGLTPETAYTFKVTAYDTFGNASAEQTLTFTTLSLGLETFTVTPSVLSIPKNGTSATLTFKVTAEDGSDVTNQCTITYAHKTGQNNDGSDATHEEYDATNKQLKALANAIGHGTGTFTATNGSSSITADIEYFVYETDVHVKFKLSKDETAYHEVTGQVGQLKETIDDKLTADNLNATHANVYELIVDGNLNDADLKTLRHMAGGNDKAEAEAELGNLHVLDMTGVRFIATPAYANDLPANSSQAELEALEKLRKENGFVTCKDIPYNAAALRKLEGEEGNKVKEKGNFIIIGAGLTPDKSVTWQYVPGETAYTDKVDITINDEGETIGIAGHEFMPSHIFNNCVNLTEVTLPSTVKFFGNYCFDGCTNLTTVKNYQNVLDFGTYAFSGTAIESFDLTTASASSNLRTVGTAMFSGCKNLTEVKMSDDIKVIGAHAFSFCPNMTLENGHLPNELLVLGDYAFYLPADGEQPDGTKTAIPEGGMKRKIEKVVLGSKLMSVGGYAFDTKQAAGGLKGELELDFSSANDLRIIGYRAFADNNGMTLTSAKIPAGVREIGPMAFAGTAITAVELPTNSDIRTLKWGVFGWCDQLESVTNAANPGNIKYIADNAFFQDHKMVATAWKDVSTIKEIGASAFAECYALTDEFKEATNVETIGQEGFAGCTNLTSESGKSLMSKLQRLEYRTFGLCTALSEIWLPTSLTYMADRVFDYPVGLKTVHVANPVAPTMAHADLTATATDDKGQETTVDYDIFLGSKDNQIEVDFTDEMKDASNNNSGYNTYRANKHFMKVMKRYLDENAAKYDVPAQFGADVTLKRTVKKSNWNTLVLPFALRNNYNRSGHTANVLTTALGSNGKFAAYRGLKWDSTFMFLLYKAENAVKANLPVLFYTDDNITEMSFTDVDVNFDDQGNRTEAADMKAICYTGAIGQALEDGVEQNGEVELLKPTKYDKYQFNGSFYTIYSAGAGTDYAKADNTLIKDGDYFIQNNKFYVTSDCANQPYRLKGYRGWFQLQSNGTPASAANTTMEIMTIDYDDSVVNELISVDARTGEQIEAEDIYTLGGVLVRKNATTADGLPKGIYVKGGKKMVVK